MRRILMVLCLFPMCLQAQAVDYTTDVFVHGQGGYPAYRIPSIVTARKGTLLAFAEGRSSLSDHAENDIVLKRSTDSGRTWGPLQVVAEAGKDNLNNPQAVVLPESGRILMMYQVFPQNYHARTIGKRIKLARPGISGEGVQKCYTTYSDDDGKTWSRQVDVTAQTKRHDTMVAFASGPGRGIVLERERFQGRIIMPFNETWYEETVRKFNVYVAYSDDGGKTWRRGQPAPHDQDKPGQSGYGNEVQAVELSDGRIMLNSRSNSGSRCRKVATSSDGGVTWSQLADDPQLPEPQCMGSIIRHTWPEDGKSRILFSNPADQSGRKLGTIRMSLDEGRTWPVARVIEDGSYAYSCLTVLEDGRIGSLYEADGYRKIRFACFGLDWLAAETNSQIMNVPAPETSDVFVAGAEKVRGEKGKNYAQYREQNVIVTESGRVVVVCQGRNKSRWSDRSGQDLVCKWSADYGKTWSEDVLVVTHGQKSVCPNAAVYDAQTNRIHVLYNLFVWDYTRVPKDVRGELGDLHCRQFVVTSDDEGQTWSKPREITEMVDTKGAVMVVGSGEGIQLKYGPSRGRLLVAGGDFYQGKKVLCYYSDDHGRTWQRSNVVPWEGEMAWASESKVAELPDGAIVLNSRTFVRNGSKQRLRTCAYSRDGGISWTKLQNVPDLKTVSCNGSLIAIDYPNAEKGAVLLCSVPAGPGRTHGTVYASFDSGRTWPLSKVVVAEEFAYSSLALLPDGKIGLFYESKGYESIRLARFALDWLLADSQETAKQPFYSRVFAKGANGVDTYRIPSVITTSKGTVLAFAEARKKSSRDKSPTDLVLRRSLDRGKTWQDIRTVWKGGDAAIMNPTGVIDRKDGTIILACNYIYRSRGIDQIWILKSSDDGQTWTREQDITDVVGPVHPGPGIGIQLKTGRLLIPGRTKDDGGQSLVIYSDDHGRTWKAGCSVAPNTNESQVVELSDGGVMLNARSTRGKRCRYAAVSTDGGETWSQQYDDTTLIEPVCQGSIIGYRQEDDDQDCVLFANPASQKGRLNGTVRLSSDGGKTWSASKVIYKNGYAYSCLTVLDDNTIGCLFERDGYKSIDFVRFSIHWLMR